MEDIIGFEFHQRFYADLQTRTVLRDSKALDEPLMLMEFAVLEFFLNRPCELIPRAQVTPLSGTSHGLGRLPITDYVSKINRKLGWKKGEVFVLARKSGYTLKTDVRPVYGIDRQVSGEIFKIAEFNFNFHTVKHMRASLGQSLEVIKKNPHGLPQARITAAYDYINLSQAAYSAELPSTVIPEARKLALEATEYPITAAAGHGVLGLICLIYDYDWDKAAKEFTIALDIDRDESATLLSYAHFLVASGKPEEAVESIGRAARLAPDDIIIHVSEGWIHTLAGNENEGIRLGKKAVELHPSFMPAHMMLGWAYEQAKRYDDAFGQYQLALEAEYTPAGIAALGHLYGKRGNREKSLEMLVALATLHERGAIKYLPAYCCALIYAGMKRIKQCLDELERAYYEQRCDWLIHLVLDRRWDVVRDARRFKLIVSRVSIPYLGEAS